MGEKRIAEAYILGIPFGLFGAHHFYLGRKFFGILYVCTLGLFGLGYLYDLIRMRWIVRHVNRYGNDKKMVTDCYLIGFLGGLFGAHHFYLGNKRLGIFYACTLGVFTVGWIADLIRMRHLVKDYNNRREEKSLGTAYILGLSPLGIFGAYHYYLDNIQLGLIYTFTLGIFGIGWIVDLFRMPQLVRKAGHDTKSVGTAYIMAFPPFGLFGAYHYYLGNYALGILYTCTLGIFGIGWVVDLFRMKGLVKAANDSTSDHGMTKITAYVLCASPLGIFGAHHFYLARYLNGGFYAATLGLFGFGWIFDILRLPVLYERYANEDQHKYADEAYIFWFPFGLFGLHQFYLQRQRWGILYACTLGCFGIGWVIDGFRLPQMLKDYNNRISDPDMVDFRICRPSCKSCSVNRIKRRCIGMFTCCTCFGNFSLPRSSTKRRGDSDSNSNDVKDDFDVIKETYPDENQQNYNQEMTAVPSAPDGIAFVQENYDAYAQDDNTGTPAYDNGAYPGDPGYDDFNRNENYDQHTTQNNIDNPLYPVEQDAYAENYDQNPDSYEQNTYEAYYDQNGQHVGNVHNTHETNYDPNTNGEKYDQNAYNQDYDHTPYDPNSEQSAYDEQNNYNYTTEGHEQHGVTNPEYVKLDVDPNQHYSQRYSANVDPNTDNNVQL